MKRAFLILLVTILILISAAVQGVAESFPGGEERFLGMIPKWDLRFAVPCGVFAAAELVLAMGIGAQVLLGVLRGVGKPCPVLDLRLRQLVLCSLWCGWTFTACCTTGISSIMRFAGAPGDYIPVVCRNFGMIGAGVMLACHVGNGYLRGGGGAIPGVLALGLAVALGHVWHDSYVALLPLCVLMGGAGLAVRCAPMLWGGRKWCVFAGLAALVASGVCVFVNYASHGLEVDAYAVLTLCLVLGLAALLSAIRIFQF